MALQYSVNSTTFEIRIFGDGYDVKIPKNPETGLNFADASAAEAYAVAAVGKLAESIAQSLVNAPQVALTPYAFLSRFTPAELLAFEERKKTDTVASLYWSLISIVQDVRSYDPNTRAAVQYLNAVGILTEQRVTEILDF